MEFRNFLRKAAFTSLIISILALIGCGAVLDSSNFLSNGMPFHSGNSTPQQSYNYYLVGIAQQNIQRAKSNLPFMEPVSFQDWQSGFR